ncbi:hypothetical protein N7472_005459 [Penicillium cf. griseofulvum]|uniref:Uncharacterized protein n=1 Tax=Penicillium cf. griseofulvum TaxID=2972120 RepID=A0A9W9JNL9_9EURO|nr:hypothetical protein N7472_005459 [Penicillium cf. griseofulvum]
MRVLPQGFGKSKPSFLLLLLLVIAIAAQVSAVPADETTDADAAKTTDDLSTTSSVSETTTSSTTSTTKSRSTTSTSSESTETTMDTTTTSSSTETDSSTTTSSVSTTTESSTSSSSATDTVIVTIPPTANAPYMQESNAPEGTVFIAVGAALGLIGLTLLAWHAMVAWSVNRSVRRAAQKEAINPLLRRPNERCIPRQTWCCHSRKLQAQPDEREQRSFLSPTAGGPAGSHASLHATGSAGNRASTYLPAGYYAAAGTSNPAPSGEVPYSPTAGLSSPSLPPAGVYHDPYNQRHSYVGASTSSLNLNQAPQGRAPSAYLEDLFESHVPHSSDSGRR